MILFFWILLALVFYTYLGYGLLLYLLLYIKRIFFSGKPSASNDFQPPVTLVVPAYNEEAYIEAKAHNSLALDYPSHKLKILFITDGSTDHTYQILKEMSGIRVEHQDRRAGKAAAENRAMQFVDTPIVVFCDANTALNPNCINELVKHYKDTKVGAVAGEKRILQKNSDNASGAGEGFYWKYESLLKKWDAELYTVVGAAGELISFRSELVQDLEEDTILDDFVQSLRICEKGYRVLYEPKAFAVETASENVGEELKRKIRIAAGGWQAMSRLKRLLNPFRDPLLTFQYISHRVLRWSLSAFALPVIFILNFWLAWHVPGFLYQAILVAQLLFYLFALIGWLMVNRNLKFKIFFIPYYFLMMNYAVFAGFFRWVRKDQQATWEKVRRAQASSNS